MHRLVLIFLYCLSQLQMEIETLTKNQPEFFGDKILERSGGKKKNNLKQADQIVRLIFWYGNSCFSIEILTDVCFPFKRKETQHCRSLSFKLSRIRFLPPLKVIATVNSLTSLSFPKIYIL